MTDDQPISAVIEFLRHLMEQDVPGSVVLLIVVLCLFPYITSFVKYYITRRSRNGDQG